MRNYFASEWRLNDTDEWEEYDQDDTLEKAMEDMGWTGTLFPDKQYRIVQYTAKVVANYDFWKDEFTFTEEKS